MSTFDITRGNYESMNTEHLLYFMHRGIVLSLLTWKKNNVCPNIGTLILIFTVKVGVMI